MEGIHAGTRRSDIQCVSALRCVFSTRRVSQIIEFHLGGLAQLTLSVRRFLEPCNYLEQRTVNRFQIYSRLAIQLIMFLRVSAVNLIT